MAGSIQILKIDTHAITSGVGKANNLSSFIVEGTFTYTGFGNRVYVRCICIQPNGTPEAFDSGPWALGVNQPWNCTCAPTNFMNSIPLSAHLLGDDMVTALADPAGGVRVTL
jgi:hypothetical protein